MGVNFYFAKRKGGKVFDEWNWPDKDWNGMGYGHFNLTRARLASLFHPYFGLVYEHLPVKAGMSAEEQEMLEHVDRFLPPIVCHFVCQPDCDGLLTRKQCEAFVREMEGVDVCGPVAPCSIQINEAWMLNPKTRTDDNSWMNHPDWVKSTEYLVGGIREAAKRKCVFAWG